MYMNIVLLSNSIQKTIYICMNELGIILKIVQSFQTQILTSKNPVPML